MNQRHVALIVVLLLVVGVGIAGVSSLGTIIQAPLSPTPTPEALLFNDNKGNNTESVQATQPNAEEKVQGTITVEPTKSKMKQYSTFPGSLPEAELKNKKAVIETAKGKIEFEILPEAPKAASNFIFLTKDNYYDGLTFHRVVPGFVIQGGDPRGDGTGGPGYKFEDEPVTRKYDKGIVAMANAGPNTNGSQFFIMLENNPLPPQYTIFGKVISGQEIVDQIKVGDVMKKITIEELNR